MSYVPPLLEQHKSPRPLKGCLHGGSAQDVSRGAAPTKRQNGPVAAPAPPRVSGSEGREEAGSAFSDPLQHSASDLLAAKAEGGDYRSRSSDTTPERA